MKNIFSYISDFCRTACMNQCLSLESLQDTYLATKRKTVANISSGDKFHHKKSARKSGDDVYVFSGHNYIPIAESVLGTTYIPGSIQSTIRMEEGFVPNQWFKKTEWCKVWSPKKEKTFSKYRKLQKRDIARWVSVKVPHYQTKKSFIHHYMSSNIPATPSKSTSSKNIP